MKNFLGIIVFWTYFLEIIPETALSCTNLFEDFNIATHQINEIIEHHGFNDWKRLHLRFKVS